MTRISKKAERRATSPRKHKNPLLKTGPKKDHFSKKYKLHDNALPGERNAFIPKIK